MSVDEGLQYKLYFTFPLGNLKSGWSICRDHRCMLVLFRETRSGHLPLTMLRYNLLLALKEKGSPLWKYMYIAKRGDYG